MGRRREDNDMCNRIDGDVEKSLLINVCFVGWVKLIGNAFQIHTTRERVLQ